jgi:hypothetical protein
VQKLHEDEANNRKAQADVERYRPSAEKDEIPREPIRNAPNLVSIQKAAVESQVRIW